MVRTLLVLALVCGCSQDNLDEPIEVGALDRGYFDCEVAPLLIEGCGTLACHGSEARPFTIYGRARHRMERPSPWTVAAWEATLSAPEEQANFDAAAAFAIASDPLILAKPLSVSSGGSYHGAVGMFGPQDVFDDRNDVTYATIEAWINGATHAGPCESEAPPDGQGGSDGSNGSGDDR